MLVKFFNRTESFMFMVNVYGDADRDLFKRGCEKFRNMIVGPANCRKTFMLKTLEHIYHAYCNPESDKYVWVGVDQGELIVLQDFRWSSELICWKGVPPLLEKELVKVPFTEIQFACDICISKDMPISATSKSNIDYAGKYNTMDERKTEMTDARKKIFGLFYRIPQDEETILRGSSD